MTTAQTNLGVYPKSTTYTKTEVDSKTTVASTAQAQGWTSNTTLLTPLRLAESFKGANQLFADGGFQRMPGGLIIQWGSGIADATGKITGSWPTTFPTAILQLVATSGAGANGIDNVRSATLGQGSTNSTYTIWQNLAQSGNVINYIVVGW